MNDLEQRIIDVLLRNAPASPPPDTIARGTRLREDLELDSLQFIVVLLEVQQETGLDFVGQGFRSEGVDTVGALIDACSGIIAASATR
jgi:acyl carrier protein